MERSLTETLTPSSFDIPAESDGEPAAAAPEEPQPEPGAHSEEPTALAAGAGEATEAPAEPPVTRREGGTQRGQRRDRRGPARAAAQAERGFPRAERPGNVPAPQHHHLPGWVRRDFAKARPALADLLGLLQGDDRASFQRRVDDLTAGITSGKFSLAWQYPTLIEEGRKLYDAQRAHIAEHQRAQRQLESARRRANDRLREAGDVIPAEASARLGRSLRQASDLAGIAEAEAEVDRALSSARSAGSKRRDREIERTRNRLLRTLPKAALVEEPQSESWQDVLRRFAQEQIGTVEEPTPQPRAGAGAGD